MKSLLVLFSCVHALLVMAHAQHDSRSNVLEFPGGHMFAITQLCIDKGYLRPFHPVRTICHSNDNLSISQCPADELETILLKLPVTQIKRYDLGLSRSITRVDRIQTQNISLGHYFDFFNPSPRKFSIPNCPNSMIAQPPQLVSEVEPTTQERIIYTALFQRGITLIRQSTPSYQPGLKGLLYQFNENNFTLKIQAPQCQSGRVEFSEDFINYLKLPEAIDFLFYDVDPYENETGGEGSGAGGTHPILNLRLIGGEGSGAGRIVMGGEGSGAGRALEGRHFDPMDTNSGEIQVDVSINWEVFNRTDYPENEIQQIIEQLDSGLQVPNDQVGVQCQ
jgi:hypothetical protein